MSRSSDIKGRIVLAALLLAAALTFALLPTDPAASVSASVPKGPDSPVLPPDGSNANPFGDSPILHQIVAGDPAAGASQITAASSPAAPVRGFPSQAQPQNSNWTPQVSGTTNNLHDVDFVDNTEGWVVGDGGTILHTINGGALWVPQTSGAVEDLLSVDFLDPLVGFAAGAGGTVLKTIDGGVTWTPVTAGQFTPPFGATTTPNLITTVDVGEFDGVWIVGRNRVWYTSDDLGGSWQGQEPNLSNSILEINALEGGVPFFAKALTFSPSSGGRIFDLSTSTPFVTENTFVPSSLVVGRLLAIDTTFANTGLVVGEGGTILRLLDFSTWGPHTGSGQVTTGNLNDVTYASVSDVFIVGNQGEILRSVDGGVSFVVEAAPGSADLNAVSFPLARDGWAVGDGGTILKFGPAPVGPNPFGQPQFVPGTQFEGGLDITVTSGENTTHLISENFFTSAILHRSLSSGGEWSAPFDISGGSGDGSGPRITNDSSGRLYAVWRTSTQKIRFNEKPPGESWVAPSTVASSPDSEPFDLPVVEVDSLGNVHAAWVKGNVFVSGASLSILHSVRPASTTTWQGPVVVTGGFQSSFGIHLEMAIDSNDQVHLVYAAKNPSFDDKLDVFHVRKPLGQAWEAPQNLSNDAAESESPSIVVDDSGGAMVVWSSTASEPTVKAVPVDVQRKSPS